MEGEQYIRLRIELALTEDRLNREETWCSVWAFLAGFLLPVVYLSASFNADSFVVHFGEFLYLEIVPSGLWAILRFGIMKETSRQRDSLRERVRNAPRD